MPGITNCEFMVKGYHYTEPTTPTRIDSCRLYLDTTIDGEESSVENNVWEMPSTTILEASPQSEEKIVGDLTGTSKSSPLSFSNLQNDDIFTIENLPEGVTTNTPITYAEIQENYSSESMFPSPALTSPYAAIIYYIGESGSPHLRCALVRSSNDGTTFTNIIVHKNEYLPYKAHLKGIHGFYFQT